MAVPDAPQLILGSESTTAVVDAPTALTSFQLALRLPRYRCRTTQGTDHRWRVFVELGDEEGLAGVIKAVETWLVRERIASTELRVGDDVHLLRGTC